MVLPQWPHQQYLSFASSNWDLTTKKRNTFKTYTTSKSNEIWYDFPYLTVKLHSHQFPKESYVLQLSNILNHVFIPLFQALFCSRKNLQMCRSSSHPNLRSPTTFHLLGTFQRFVGQDPRSLRDRGPMGPRGTMGPGCYGWEIPARNGAVQGDIIGSYYL